MEEISAVHTHAELVLLTKLGKRANDDYEKQRTAASQDLDTPCEEKLHETSGDCLSNIVSS